MAGIVQDITDSLSNPTGGSKNPPTQQSSEEPTFNILPHPAESNDPADLQKPSDGGLGSSLDALETLKADPGPVMLSQEMLDNLGPAKTPEQLKALQEELNKKS